MSLQSAPTGLSGESKSSLLPPKSHDLKEGMFDQGLSLEFFRGRQEGDPAPQEPEEERTP